MNIKMKIPFPSYYTNVADNKQILCWWALHLCREVGYGLITWNIK